MAKLADTMIKAILRSMLPGTIQGAVTALGVAAVVMSSTGCPQASAAVPAIVPGVTFAVCVLSTYTQEPSGAPILKVISDIQTACGGDEQSVISVLDAHEAPALHQVLAHQSALGGPDAGGCK
jgi:hypothetical protein